MISHDAVWVTLHSHLTRKRYWLICSRRVTSNNASLCMMATCHQKSKLKSYIPDSKFMGPTWGPSGADRTQVGPMLAPWTLLSGMNWYFYSERCKRTIAWFFSALHIQVHIHTYTYSCQECLLFFSFIFSVNILNHSSMLKSVYTSTHATFARRMVLRRHQLFCQRHFQWSICIPQCRYRIQISAIVLIWCH